MSEEFAPLISDEYQERKKREDAIHRAIDKIVETWTPDKKQFVPSATLTSARERLALAKGISPGDFPDDFLEKNNLQPWEEPASRLDSLKNQFGEKVESPNLAELKRLSGATR